MKDTQRGEEEMGGCGEKGGGLSVEEGRGKGERRKAWEAGERAEEEEGKWGQLRGGEGSWERRRYGGRGGGS